MSIFSRVPSLLYRQAIMASLSITAEGHWYSPPDVGGVTSPVSVTVWPSRFSVTVPLPIISMRGVEHVAPMGRFSVTLPAPPRVTTVARA